jgi:hypothetical protein
MNKPLLAAVICLFLSCGVRILPHTNAKINLNKFNSKQVHDTIRRYIAGTEFIEARLPDGSFTGINVHRDNTGGFDSYYYRSGRLKSWVFKIGENRYGKSPLYDDNGDLIKVTDYDEPFTFTIPQLASKFRSAYGILIFNKGTTVSKSSGDSLVYRINVPVDSPSGNKIRRFVVDGTTGKTLSDITSPAL